MKCRCTCEPADMVRLHHNDRGTVPPSCMAMALGSNFGVTGNSTQQMFVYI